MSYLTPNSLSGSVTLEVTIPDDVLLKAAIVGSITPLVFVDNWESYGSQTPADTAAAMATVIDNLAWGSGGSGFVAELTRVQLASGQFIASGYPQLLFDTVLEDDASLWDNTNHKAVIAADGMYQITLALGIANFPRNVYSKLVLNSITNIPMLLLDSSGGVCSGCHTITMYLNSGDELTAWAAPTAGVTILSDTTFRSEFSILRLA